MASVVEVTCAAVFALHRHDQMIYVGTERSVQPRGIVRVGEQIPVDVEGDRDAAMPRREKWTEPAPPVGLRRCRAEAARPVELLVV